MNMETFEERISCGNAHEEAVMQRLRQLGWSVFSYGQGMMPKEMRIHLRNFRDREGNPTLLRWLPDVFTSKDDRAFLVDAKGGTGKNYAIETHSVDCHIAMQQRGKMGFGIPIVYVFHDFTVISVVDFEFGIRHRTIERRDGVSRGRTPFYLLYKNRGITIPFDEFFGP